jgi:hypothetical protein
LAFSTIAYNCGSVQIPPQRAFQTTPHLKRQMCSETPKLDRFWLESSAPTLWLGETESDEAS